MGSGSSHARGEPTFCPLRVKTSILKFVWAHDSTSESDELYNPLQSSGAHIAGSEARGPRRSSGPYLMYLLIRFDAYRREASNNRSSRANWERGHVRAIWQWFLVQSVPVKIVLGRVALGLSVALSPLWALVAFLAFFVSLIAVVFQAFRRRPFRAWGIAVLSSFVLMLAFSGISNAVYSPASSPSQEGGAPVVRQATL